MLRRGAARVSVRVIAPSAHVLAFADTADPADADTAHR